MDLLLDLCEKLYQFYPNVEMDDLGEDNYCPKGRSLVVRGSNRLLRHWHQAELERDIARKISAFQPDVLIVYKGNAVSAKVVCNAKKVGVFTVNVFPDCSPHAHGNALRKAMGEYDFVISTKPFHPSGWQSIYGYRNNCECVPHGYDPAVHYWPDIPINQDLDIVLAATWRLQYETVFEATWCNF